MKPFGQPITITLAAVIAVFPAILCFCPKAFSQSRVSAEINEPAVAHVAHHESHHAKDTCCPSSPTSPKDSCPESDPSDGGACCPDCEQDVIGRVDERTTLSPAIQSVLPAFDLTLLSYATQPAFYDDLRARHVREHPSFEFHGDSLRALSCLLTI